MSLTREEIDALKDGGKFTLTLDDGDVTVDSYLETRIGGSTYPDKPDEMSLTGINPGSLSPDNIDGLDIDLNGTEILVRVDYQFPDEQSVTVDSASFTVVTDVEGASSEPYRDETWGDDRHTFQKFELTGVELIED